MKFLLVAAVEGCLAEGAAHGGHAQDGPRCRRKARTVTGIRVIFSVRKKETGRGGSG
jgi:hypothetical protein